MCPGCWAKGLWSSLGWAGGEDCHSREHGQTSGGRGPGWVWGTWPTWAQTTLNVERDDDGTASQSGSQKRLGETGGGRWVGMWAAPSHPPPLTCFLPAQATEAPPDLRGQHCRPPRAAGALSLHGEQPQDPGGALPVAGLPRRLPHKGVSLGGGVGGVVPVSAGPGGRD